MRLKGIFQLELKTDYILCALKCKKWKSYLTSIRFFFEMIEYKVIENYMFS